MKLELIKKGMPTDVEILSQNAMSNVLGGQQAQMVKCKKGYNAQKGICRCGFESTCEMNVLQEIDQ